MVDEAGVFTPAELTVSLLVYTGLFILFLVAVYYRLMSRRALLSKIPQQIMDYLTQSINLKQRSVISNETQRETELRLAQHPTLSLSPISTITPHFGFCLPTHLFEAFPPLPPTQSPTDSTSSPSSPSSPIRTSSLSINSDQEINFKESISSSWRILERAIVTTHPNMPRQPIQTVRDYLLSLIERFPSSSPIHSTQSLSLIHSYLEIYERARFSPNQFSLLEYSNFLSQFCLLLQLFLDHPS